MLPFVRCQEAIGNHIRIDELIEGDVIDLQDDQYADTDPDGDTAWLEYEYAVVDSVEREMAEGENDDCLLVVLVSGGSVGFPPDHLVVWGGHPDHTVDDGDRENPTD